MTEHIQINDVAPRIHYLADGVQAAFGYSFAIFKDGDLEVWLDGQRQDGGFAVSGAGISTGGAVLFAVPPAAGRRVTLRRRLVLERTTDYQADGIIRAKTLNDELDYQVAALQQVAEDVDRAVKRASTSGSLADLTLPEPLAGRALKWDAAAGGLTNTLVDPDTLGSAVVDAQAARDLALAARDVAVTARDEAVAASSQVVEPLVRSGNLADLPDVAAARSNLGLGNAALKTIGTGAGQIPTADQVPGLINVPPAVPAGLLAPFAGAAAPAGWLLCNGAVVGRAAHAALFAAIGTVFGAGDGSTTFALPDLRGRAAIGAGTGSGLTARTLAQMLGAETHTLSVSEMPSHAHSLTLKKYGSANSESGYSVTLSGIAYTDPGNGSASAAGGGGAHNNMPPSLALNFIIKT